MQQHKLVDSYVANNYICHHAFKLFFFSQLKLPLELQVTSVNVLC